MQVLDPGMYGLSDEKEQFQLDGVLALDKSEASLAEVIQALETIYCGAISAEFLHMQVNSINL